MFYLLHLNYLWGAHADVYNVILFCFFFCYSFEYELDMQKRILYNCCSLYHRHDWFLLFHHLPLCFRNLWFVILFSLASQRHLIITFFPFSTTVAVHCPYFFNLFLWLMILCLWNHTITSEHRISKWLEQFFSEE